jgi:hypothetical protein
MSKRGHQTPNYMPNTEAELIAWLSRFLNNLLPLLGLLEIDREETYDPLLEDLGMVQDTRSCIGDIDTIRPALTDTKDEQLYANDLSGEVVSPRQPGRIFPAFSKARKGLVKRIDNLVKTIKAHPNYTESIGFELGIIAPEPPPVDYTKVRSHGHDAYDGGNQLELLRTIAHGCDGYKIWLNIDHAGYADKDAVTSGHSNCTLTLNPVPVTRTLYEIKTQQTRAGKLVGVATTSTIILQQGMPVKHIIPKGAEETATP